MFASRIVELSCLFWSARGLWKVVFQVSDAIRVQAAPGGPFRGFLGSASPFDVILFRSVSGAKISKK